MGTGRRISEKLTENDFVRNVIGPRVLEPVTTWYEENLRDHADGDGADDGGGRGGDGDGDGDGDGAGAGGAAAPGADTDRQPARDDATDIIDLTGGERSAGEGAAAASTGVSGASSATGATAAAAGRPGGSRSLESARAAERFLGTDAEGASRTSTAAADEPRNRAVPFGRGSAGGDPSSTATATNVDEVRAGVGVGVAAPDDTDATPAPAPAKGGFRGVKDIAMRLKTRVKHHNLNVVAAGIAFWGLLAIPAILTATISIYGLVASPDDVERQIEDLASGMSEEGRAVITDQLSAVTSSSGGGLAVGAVIGIVLALWSSSGAVAKMINTMNLIWEVREDRKFFELRGVAIAITLGSILFFLSTAFLLAVVPALLDSAGLGDAARWVIGIARFPAMLLFMMVGLAFLYWFGPNRDSRWRFVTWGAFVGTVGWLVISGLFSVYTTYFASYNETYAGIGGVVILLLWLFVTAFMVLVGAEIDAAREERDEELAALERA